jgi:hypothetical protein
MRIDFTKKRKLSRKVCGQEISIVPYIDTSKKRLIIEKLITYFQESLDAGNEYYEIICETRGNYDVLVIQLNTDVEILPDDSYEDMLSSGLIDVVRTAVYNYDEVYDDAMIVLSMLKISSILPQVDSMNDIFSKLTNSLENMDDKQKSNLEIFAKAAMANAANTAIMRSAKNGE